MAALQTKLDSVKESIASLFKVRRRGSSSQQQHQCKQQQQLQDDSDGSISLPQNVKRIGHVSFNSGDNSFEVLGVPEHWMPHFEAAAAAAAAAATTAASAIPSTGAPSSVAVTDIALCSSSSRNTNDDDSGVSMTTGSAVANGSLPSSSQHHAEHQLELTDLPRHWRDRLERNNLLGPEFRKNPALLMAVFGLMDEELKAMNREGFELDKAMYSSSPAVSAKGEASGQCNFDLEGELGPHSVE